MTSKEAGAGKVVLKRLSSWGLDFVASGRCEHCKLMAVNRYTLDRRTICLNCLDTLADELRALCDDRHPRPEEIP